VTFTGILRIPFGLDLVIKFSSECGEMLPVGIKKDILVLKDEKQNGTSKN
jgi:hypothetical protein